MTEKTSLSRSILSYLVTHPNAEDTVEGITQWWLLENEIQRRIIEVEQALGELIATGYVVEQRGRNAEILYRLNPERLPEVKRELAR